ncbi:MAG: phosphoribosylanthranilate isomerase [Candidatus Hydrogenedentes bacterium]|nr:phosphoribosylanthranilate isomerase [Candidatus Hydrogenedentota bacterium]
MPDNETRVKICGITSYEDARAICDAGADALGFNFAPEAKKRGRYITPDDARGIIRRLPSFVSHVAVTVNDSQENLLHYLTFVDRVQLHGEESIELCASLAPDAIKAFRAAPGFQPESMLRYPASAYLLDAWAPDARGGTGKVFDWQIAKTAVELGHPLILAGGLTPENVADAVRAVRPYAVDTAGGVESAPGKKDYAKVREFVRNAKSALSVS